LREHRLDLRTRKAVHPREDAREHRAILVQDRIVAILEQRLPLDTHLFAQDPTALQRSSEHPVDRAMPMVGAAISVLAQGPAELAEHDDYRVAPTRAHLFGERGEPFAQLRQARCEGTLRSALVHVGIPPAYVDE